MQGNQELAETRLGGKSTLRREPSVRAHLPEGVPLGQPSGIRRPETEAGRLWTLPPASPESPRCARGPVTLNETDADNSCVPRRQRESGGQPPPPRCRARDRGPSPPRARSCREACAEAGRERCGGQRVRHAPVRSGVRNTCPLHPGGQVGDEERVHSATQRKKFPRAGSSPSPNTIPQPVTCPPTGGPLCPGPQARGRAQVGEATGWAADTSPWPRSHTTRGWAGYGQATQDGASC